MIRLTIFFLFFTVFQATNSQIVKRESGVASISGKVLTTTDMKYSKVYFFNNKIATYGGKIISTTLPVVTETNTYISRFTVKANDPQKYLVDSLVRMLKDSSLFNSLDVFYNFNLHDEQAGRQNLVSNNFNLTLFGSGTDPILYHGKSTYCPGKFYGATGYDSLDFRNLKFSDGCIAMWPDSIETVIDHYSWGLINTTPYTAGKLSFNGDQYVAWGSTNDVNTHTMVRDSLLTVGRSGTTFTKYIDDRLDYTTPMVTLPAIVRAGGSFGIFGAINTADSPSGVHASKLYLKQFFTAKYLSSTELRKMKNILRWFNDRAKYVF